MTTSTVTKPARSHIAHQPHSRPATRSRRRWVWLSVPLFGTLVGAAYLTYARDYRAAPPEPATRPASRPMGVSALGRLAPDGEVIAVASGSASDGGRVDRLMVAVGDRVAEGQVVAILDTHRRRSAAALEARGKVAVAQAKLDQTQAGPKPEDVRAQEALILRCEAELKAAERDLGRISNLEKRAVSSRQELDDQSLKFQQTRESLNQENAKLAALKAVRSVDVHVAEAELAQARASLALAQAELEAAEVRSPIKGRVLRILVRPGERIGDQGIIEVGNIDVMQAVAEVYEEDVGKVQIGQPARIRVPTVAANLAGVVVRKDLVVSRKVIFNNDPVADIDARVIEVRIRLAADDSSKVSGLSNARAEVVIDTTGVTK
jgi:HlyD family secretion protein